MKPIELRPAYVWDCDNCSCENFTTGVIYEFDEETEKEMKEDHGIEVWETGDWITIPETVTCKCCGVQYSTYDYRAESDEEF